MAAAYEPTPYMWPILALAGTLGAMALYAWRHRSIPGALPFAIMTALAVPWAIAVGLEIAAVDIGDKVLWAKFQRTLNTPAITAGLWFALDYTNLNRWLTRRTLLLLAVPPVLYLLMALTNSAHHLAWRGFTFDGDVHLISGRGGWAFTDYGLVLGMVTSLVFVWLFMQSPLHRRPVALCLAGQIASRGAYLLDLRGANPFAPMDLAMVAAFFAYVMYAIALFRFRLFDLVPVAYGTVIEQMREGMLVLDGRQRIVDLNPAAETILGMSGERARGADLATVLSRSTVSGSWLPGTPPREITVGAGPVAKHYAVHVSPLDDRRRFQRGQLLLLHDITEQTQAQAQILEQQRALATLRERERVARELHDNLGQVLGFVKMEAQVARHLLARDRPSEADAYLARVVATAQDAHVDVREYIVGARAALPGEGGFIASLDGFLHRFRETSGIATSLDAPLELRGCPFEPMVAAQLLPIIQEALTNVRKHAAAHAVHVRLAVVGGHAETIVQDDGVGFDPAAMDTPDGQRFGLRFMRERAEEVGGSVDLRSAVGHGTEVVIAVPLRQGALCQEAS